MESVVLAAGSASPDQLIARLLVAAALHGFPSQIPGSNAAVTIDVPIDSA